MTALRVKDAIDAFNAIFEKIMTVRAAGSVTLLAGALVLAGALATAQRRRILEAVILKTWAPPAGVSSLRTLRSTSCWPPSRLCSRSDLARSRPGWP